MMDIIIKGSTCHNSVADLDVLWKGNFGCPGGGGF